MGRKFESERAIFYAERQALLALNATVSGYDLLPTGLGSIRYIQVKWSSGPTSAVHTVDWRRSPDTGDLLHVPQTSCSLPAEVRRAHQRPASAGGRVR